jgi:hypothetical protein
VKLWHEDSPNTVGWGECALFKGLSCDDRPDYEATLRSLTPYLPPEEELFSRLKNYPSILVGKVSFFKAIFNLSGCLNSKGDFCLVVGGFW